MGFFKRFFKILFILALLLLSFYCWGRYVEPSLVDTTYTSIESPRLPQAAWGVRVVLFSDTHLGADYTTDMLESAVEKINEQKPNIVAFTGDLYEDYQTYPVDDDEVIRILSSVEAPLGKFAVLGNHDFAHNRQPDVERVLEASGFQLLRNESVGLDLVGVTVTGIDDCIFGDGGPEQFDALSADTYNLVLCHEPDIFTSCGGTYLDLMLSGHTHGGQVKIPFYGAFVLPKLGRIYPEGLYKNGDAELYVNRGLGMSKPAFRFLCKPEISVIDLES